MQPLIPPPVIVILFGSAMSAIARVVPFGLFSFEGQRLVAGALLLVGMVLMGAALLSFMAKKTTVNPLRPLNTSSLVTAGVFALSRNPIYLGDLLVLAAWVVWTGSAVNVLLLPLFVLCLNRFQIVPEERALTQLFGADYTAYCARVRRWI